MEFGGEEAVVEVSDPGARRHGERFGRGERFGAVQVHFQGWVAEHGAPFRRERFQHGVEQLLVESAVMLQVVVAVVPFAEFADEAALQDVDDVAVLAQQGPQLAQVLQGGGGGRPVERRRQFVREAQQALGFSFTQFQEKALDVLQFAGGKVLAVAVAHQKAVALHDGDAVVGEEVELVLPLGVAELQAVEAVAANQMRHAGDVDVLKHGFFRPAVEFELFVMTRAHAGDFAGDGAEVHLSPKTAFGIGQPHAAVAIVRPNSSVVLLHWWSSGRRKRETEAN